jgi:hypothetical protein
MLLRSKFCHSVITGLAFAALLSGCAAGQNRRAQRTRIWPEAWPQPFWNRTEAQPEYQPVPADPSGSPYQPNSPRGLYVPSGPAPESKLGLPVPPPLPPGGDEPRPAPEPETERLPVPIPPDGDEIDVSLDARSGRRPAVIAPPPPPELNEIPPRMAERTENFDRRRQLVDLQTPEADLDDQPVNRNLERSPVDTFPQPRPATDGLERGPGHTPALDGDEEQLPTGVDPSAHRPATGLPGPLPRLREPEESDLSFPGVNKQMSGVGRTRSPKLDVAAAHLSVRGFQLTRDVRSGSEASIISAQDLRRGQHLVVQTELDGLEKIERNGDSITRITSHVELRDAQNKVVYHTDKQSAAEVNQASRVSRHLNQWLTIPSRLKAGNYSLQLIVQDEVARQTVTVEMAVTIR